MNDSGVTLLEAYEDLKKFRRHHKCHKQTVAWGNGDTRVLKEQVKAVMPIGPDDWWDFGVRFFDTKTIFQAFMLANDISLKAGLAKALERLQMTFIGRPHDAKDDALNTFLVFQRLTTMMAGFVDRIEVQKGEAKKAAGSI
jgi:inhibitor of KinA sporulation pathway (predicted exonuclease)